MQKFPGFRNPDSLTWGDFEGKGVVALDVTFDRGKIMITMTPNVVTQNELVIVILCFFLTVIVSIFAPR